MKNRRRDSTNILFMDQFLTEQELRARRARRAKLRMESIRNRRPLTVLTQALESDTVDLTRPRMSVRPISTASVIIHTVEV